MKTKIKWICTISIFVILSSCNQSNSNGNNLEQESPFEVVKVDKKSFKSVGDSYQFTFSGEVINNSINIYDKVYTMVSIELELENGNVITARDYSSGFWVDFGDLEKAWKPNEVRKIDERGGINSDFVPKRYKDYPIKKVVAVLSFSTEDVINKTKDDFYYNLDITNIWKGL